jgi:hypothetical protein
MFAGRERGGEPLDRFGDRIRRRHADRVEAERMGVPLDLGPQLSRVGQKSRSA